MVRWWFFSFPPVSIHTRNVPFASGCAYCANICHIMISFLLLNTNVKLFRFLRHGFVNMCLFVHHGTERCENAHFFVVFLLDFHFVFMDRLHKLQLLFWIRLNVYYTRLFLPNLMHENINLYFSLLLYTCMTFCSKFVQL